MHPPSTGSGSTSIARRLVASAAALLLAACSGLGPAAVPEADAHLEAPAGWHQVSVDDLQAQLARDLPRTTGQLHDSWAYLVGEIDAGHVVKVFFSPPTEDGFTESLMVMVEDAGDASVEAAAERLLSVDALFNHDDTVLQTVFDLPFGRTLRMDRTASPTGGSPTRLIAYLFKLD